MDKLKILVFNWRCWLNPEMGGAEVFTHEILKRWVEAGHHITLFTSKFRDCREEEVSDGIRIVRRGSRYSVYRKARKFYDQFFSREGYDIVIDEINTRPFFTPTFVKGNETIIALIHQLAREYWFYETPFPMNYLGYYFLERKWLSNYCTIPTVTVSESTKNDLVDLGFEEIYVVGEGLNFKPVEGSPKKADHPIIVYAGRLKKAKRPDHAVQTFKILKEKVPDAELWIIGDGYLKNRLESISSDDVKFFGSVSNEERRNLIQKTWVLVNPSVREGFGLNVIEANALGVPSVAYDVPGLRDSIVDGETGLLAKSGDTEDLAQKTIKILTDRNLRISLSQKALAHSKSFSWDKAADEFIRVVRFHRDLNAKAL
jgi:glycosyltransferase involved in cell wall biosynthesis